MAKNVELEVTTDVREWLAIKGYDKLLGARPMQRLIQDELKKPLSESILFGDLEHGGSVKVTLVEGKPAFEITKGTKKSSKKVSAKPESKPEAEETRRG